MGKQHPPLWIVGFNTILFTISSHTKKGISFVILTIEALPRPCPTAAYKNPESAGVRPNTITVQSPKPLPRKLPSTTDVAPGTVDGEGSISTSTTSLSYLAPTYATPSPAECTRIGKSSILCPLANVSTPPVGTPFASIGRRTSGAATWFAQYKYPGAVGIPLIPAMLVRGVAARSEDFAVGADCAVVKPGVGEGP